MRIGRVDHDAILRVKSLGRFALSTIKVVLTCYLIAASAVLPVQAQTNTFAATNLSQAWSGNQTFNGIVDSSSGTSTRPIKVVTLSTIPVTCTANKDMILVSDASPNLRQRLCNASGTAFDVLGGTGIPNAFVLDGVTYTDLAGVFTAAGTTGVVIIPSSYAGTDTNSNSNHIQVIDLRGGPARYRGFINMLTDCGLKGDGITDDATAANACFAAFPGYEFYFPKTQPNGTCSYFFGSTLTPVGAAGTTIRGASGGGYVLTSGTHVAGAELCFAPGTTGILLDNAGAVLLENLSLNGQSGTNVQGVPTKLNLPSAANLPVFSRNILTIQRTANVITGTITPVGIEGLMQQVGSTINIAGVTGDTTMNGNCVIATLTASGSGSATNPWGFTCPQNGADSGPFGAVGTIKPATTGADSTDGIRVCGNFHKIINVTVANFARHGINGGSSDGGCASAFSDDLIVRDSVIVGNQGFGIYMRGIDSNAGKFDGNSIYYNSIWGAHDQSALGNTWEANQASYNALGAASATTPTTKNISTISRVLTSGISQTSVVLSSADSNIKLGSCVVIAGVTDATFNTTAGQCFFVNSFTDSTHYGYEQPGAPVNASSSGGTSRMAKFSEAMLSSGLDYGSYKIGTAASVWSQSFISNYSEGGQACKFGNTVPVMFGTTVPTGCVPAGNDFLGVYFQLVSGLQTFGTNLANFSNFKDTSRTLTYQAGISTGSARDFYLQYKDHAAVDTWGVHVINASAGAAGNYIITRGSAVAGQNRLGFWGPSTANGITRLNSESTGAIQFNISNGDGSGGLAMGDGAGNITMTVSGVGLGTFNGGLIGATLRSQTANVSAAGTVRLAKTDAINFRNNANGADITGLSLNGSDQVVLPSLAATSSAVSFTSPAFISGTANPAAAGVVRLAKTDSLSFRNNANSGDVTGLSINASDQAVLPTVASLTSAGSVTAPAMVSSTANPASAGAVRLAKTDAINFRNNANGADVAGVALDASDRVVLGGAAGVVATSIPVPGPIGGTTPAAGTFTTVTANTSVTSPAHVSSSANPASAGVVRLASGDAVNFRNNGNSGDINGVSKDASDVVQVGGNTNGVRIGTSGAAIKKVLTTTSVIDFALQAANTCTDSAGITLTGAVDGDSISVGVPAADMVANVNYIAYVSAADTVKVRLCNVATSASADPASGTFRVTVNQF